MTHAYEDQLKHDKQQLTAALKSAEDELARLRQADARVRGLHTNDYGYCSACTGLYSVPWPCLTIDALNGEPTP